MLTGAPASPTAATLSVVGAAIAVFRRKSPIGGWLFFFCWGAFVGCGNTILSEYSDRHFMLPASWKDHTKYLLYTLSLWPRVVSLFGVAALLVMAIRHPEWRWIKLLREALAIYLISELAAVLIDSFFFPTILRNAVAGLFYPIVFLSYLFFSIRVVSVFQKHDWEHRKASF